MAPQLLFDLSGIDLDHVDIDAGGIEAVNPHRGDMRMLDGIIWHDHAGQTGYTLAFKDIRDDEFWAPGHIPGRPLFPGVLMIEAAAQLASFMIIHYGGQSGFIGFVGCDKVKFRGQVVPGDRLLLLGDPTEVKPRRSICQLQAVVNGDLVFEAKITGMPF